MQNSADSDQTRLLIHEQCGLGLHCLLQLICPNA